MVRNFDLDLLTLLSDLDNGPSLGGRKGDFGLGGAPGKGEDQVILV